MTGKSNAEHRRREAEARLSGRALLIGRIFHAKAIGPSLTVGLLLGTGFSRNSRGDRPVRQLRCAPGQ